MLRKRLLIFIAVDAIDAIIMYYRSRSHDVASCTSRRFDCMLIFSRKPLSSFSAYCYSSSSSEEEID